MRGHTDRYHYPELAPDSPELKPRAGGRKGGQRASSGQTASEGKEDEAWAAMLDKAIYSVRYISRHIRKEHFIREVSNIHHHHYQIWFKFQLKNKTIKPYNIFIF